eukprot:6214822-Pleurochrysis_carterae.AAC.9
MRTARLNFNVVVKSAFLRLRLRCSEKKQMREFDEPCRYVTERYLSKDDSSIRVNSCESFSCIAEAHEVTEVLNKLIAASHRTLHHAIEPCLFGTWHGLSKRHDAERSRHVTREILVLQKGTL